MSLVRIVTQSYMSGEDSYSEFVSDEDSYTELCVL